MSNSKGVESQTIANHAGTTSNSSRKKIQKMIKKSLNVLNTFIYHFKLSIEGKAILQDIIFHNWNILLFVPNSLSVY